MRLSQPNACPPLFLSFALFASQALAADFTGRVVGVSDGDTIKERSLRKTFGVQKNRYFRAVSSRGNLWHGLVDW